jgi:uncharacterized protein YsxB (DUF464 family)
MTKVVFFKSGDNYWGFEEQGHSGFAASGDDILCSAISAMTMLVINAIEVAYAADVDYVIDEETTATVTLVVCEDVEFNNATLYPAIWEGNEAFDFYE